MSETTLSDTFSDFFSEWDEERASTELTYLRQEKADVDVALAANDQKSLRTLGYINMAYRAIVSVGPEDQSAILTSRSFNQRKYDQLCADCLLTPAQLMERMNNALNQ